MKLKRKDFIKAMGTSVGGYMLLPKFLYALNSEKISMSNDSYLVIVQLNGGNDGLNTFIPYSNPLYYENRPTIAIKAAEVLKVNKDMGWNPCMKDFANLMESGDLSLIQNVGYPNPNRSHFRSIEIWQTASGRDEYLKNGWLGRYLDLQCDDKGFTCGINMNNYDNLAMKADKSSILTLKNPDNFENLVKSISEMENDKDENPNITFVNKLILNAMDGHEEIKQALEKSKGSEAYPNSELSKNLKYISRLIKGGLKSRVYYTGRSGFDTHSNQLNVQSKNLKDVGESIASFYKDLKASNLHKDVTIMVFSEFGRRVKENGGGTDHGAAAPLFIIGGSNKNQIIGKNPNLSDLDNNGDIKFEYDFRSIYATLLSQKMKFNPDLIGIKEKALTNLF